MRHKLRTAALALLLAGALQPPAGPVRATEPRLFDGYVRKANAPEFGMLILFWLVFP